jgi:hypothetical protein
MGPDGPDHPTIDQLEHGCRFPVGVNVDGVHVFCGLPVEWKRRGAASGAYCAEHSSIAYISITPLQRIARIAEPDGTQLRHRSRLRLMRYRAAAINASPSGRKIIVFLQAWAISAGRNGGSDPTLRSRRLVRSQVGAEKIHVLMTGV